MCVHAEYSMHHNIFNQFNLVWSIFIKCFTHEIPSNFLFNHLEKKICQFETFDITVFKKLLVIVKSIKEGNK